MRHGGNSLPGSSVQPEAEQNSSASSTTKHFCPVDINWDIKGWGKRVMFMENKYKIVCGQITFPPPPH
jgi:hypothetical protein